MESHKKSKFSFCGIPYDFTQLRHQQRQTGSQEERLIMWHSLYLACLGYLFHIGYGKFVDLSWSMNPEYQSYFPVHTKFTLKVVFAGPFNSAPWVSSNDINTGEHIGTHLDAPYHFIRNGRYVDQVPFDQLHGPAVIIDIRERTKTDSDAEVTLKDLTDWEVKHGRIPDKAWILMHSGWYQYWGDNSKYIGTNSTHSNFSTEWHWPGFGMEAVTWLLTNRPGFNGIAVDTVSCENGKKTSDLNNTTPVHIKLLGADKLCLENVNSNIADVPVSGAEVFNLPMKLHHGSGAPTRFYAIHGEEKSSFAPNQPSLGLALFLMLAILINRMDEVF